MNSNVFFIFSNANKFLKPRKGLGFNFLKFISRKYGLTFLTTLIND